MDHDAFIDVSAIATISVAPRAEVDCDGTVRYVDNNGNTVYTGHEPLSCSFDGSANIECGTINTGIMCVDVARNDRNVLASPPYYSHTSISTDSYTPARHNWCF